MMVRLRHARVPLAAVFLALAATVLLSPGNARAAIFPPGTTITSGPSGTVTATSATFTFTSDQFGAGFECKLDSAAFQACASPKSYTGLSDGAHSFQVRAKNFIGEVDESPARRDWTIGTGPPDTTLTSGPQGSVSSSAAEFRFTSSDATAGFECRLDQAAFAACGSPQTYSGLSDGPHSFEVRAKNLSGRVDDSPAHRDWTIDTAPPDTTLTSGPQGSVSTRTAEFRFTSPDATAGFECRLDQGAFLPCTSPKSYTGLSDGSHSFEVRAVDKAGNLDQSPASRGWTIANAPPPPPPGQNAKRSHVFIVIMENKSYGQVIGSRHAPYVNRLARRYASATKFYALAKPSLPNYLAMIGGSTYGVHTNGTGFSIGGTTVISQIMGKGYTWDAYLESMPRTCYRRAQHGGYVKKHNPFMYFRSITHRSSRCGHVRPGRLLGPHLRRNSLAHVNWIIPNLCHSTHDCPVRTGDRYLSGLIPRLLNHVGPHGFVVLTYDEGSTSAGCCGRAHGGHIPTVIAGPDVKRGMKDRRRRELYSILGMTEDYFSVGRLRRAGCRCTAPMGDFFVVPGRPTLRGASIQPKTGFSINWAAPAKGLEAARAHITMCTAGGTQCATTRHKLRLGQRSLGGLRASVPGEYTVRLWLEDPFGNVAQTNGSNVLQLVLQ
jgi:hypothetical protein